MIRFEVIELQNGYHPDVSTEEGCKDFFLSLGEYAVQLSREHGMDTLPILPIEELEIIP